MFNGNSEICPVTVLHLYFEKKQQAATLESPRAVFIASQNSLDKPD